MPPVPQPRAPMLQGAATRMTGTTVPENAGTLIELGQTEGRV